METEHLGGLEVDDELEFRGLPDRQLVRLAPESGRIVPAIAVSIGEAGPVAQQAADLHKLAQRIVRGNRMACRQRHDLVTPAREQGVADDQQPASILLNERRECCIDVARGGALRTTVGHPEARAATCRFCNSSSALGLFRIDQYCHHGGNSSEVVQQFQPFCAERMRKHGRARDIAAGPVEVGDEAQSGPGRKHPQKQWGSSRSRILPRRQRPVDEAKITAT